MSRVLSNLAVWAVVLVVLLAAYGRNKRAERAAKARLKKRSYVNLHLIFRGKAKPLPLDEDMTCS